MIEDKLEIVIPTYNRDKYLDNTLNSLLNSPFKNCKITIRDNASPDNTPEICEKYSSLFNNFHIMRNEKNIGGNANIFRSYEQANYPYVWVLADNDILNFDKCQDFIDAIETEKYDLIICNSTSCKSEENSNKLTIVNDEPLSEYIKRHKINENYLENTAQEFASIIKNRYFEIAGFISSTIYKTSLIDSDVLITGSKYIGRNYPHFSLIAKALNENLLIYKTKYDLVYWMENTDETELVGIDWFAKYLDCISLINDKEFHSYAEQIKHHKLYYELAAQIIYAKARHDPSLKESMFIFIQSMYKLRGWGKGFLYQTYLILCYCVPTFFCEYYVKKRLK